MNKEILSIEDAKKLAAYDKLKEEKEKLIKYLEDKIKMFKELQKEAINTGYNESVAEFGLQISSYQDILERVKSGNYE